MVGVLYQKTCYLKNATMTKAPVWGTGTTASWVAGSVPVTPPLPPLDGCNTLLQMETHGYYQHGEGYQTVNSKPDLLPFAANVPPVLDRACAGGFVFV
jgi:hypothetical protein